MSTIELSIDYRCSNDCQWSGCPGHIGKLTYQTTADAYTFDMAGCEMHFERGELEAFLTLAQRLHDCRSDAVSPAGLQRRALLENGWVPPEEAERLRELAWRYEELSK